MEPSDVEPSDVEPKDVEPGDVEPRDLEPRDLDTSASRRARWREAALALPNLIKLTGRLLRDPRVPVRRRSFALVALAYVLSPVDVIPDFVPIAGQVDDVLVIALALHHLIGAADPEIVAEHWDGSGDVLELVADIIALGADLVPKPVRRLVNSIF